MTEKDKNEEKKDLEKEEQLITTEVTSLAEEAKKSGTNITMTEEQLITAASINMTKTLYKLETLLKSMKAKQIVPALIAGLDFPKDGLPVKWVDKRGKPIKEHIPTLEVFMMIQRIISDRFVLTQKHVIDQIRANKSQKTKEETTNG